MVSDVMRRLSIYGGLLVAILVVENSGLRKAASEEFCYVGCDFGGEDMRIRALRSGDIIAKIHSDCSFTVNFA